VITDAFIVLFGMLALVFAGMVLLARQPMRAALALVAHMTSLAAIYACLDVHVVALFQVLIYVGAVMVFMVYTIMLLDDRDVAYRVRFSGTLVPGVLVAIVAALALMRVLGPASPDAVIGPGDDLFSFTAFSAAFMQRYWLHFELATVLLLVGMVRDPGGAMIHRYELLLALAVALFSLGLLGVMVRRNLLVIVMSLELMLNAVVLSFVAAAAHTQTMHGAAMTFFIYVAATCEIALAMAILLLLVRRRGTLDLTAEQELRG